MSRANTKNISEETMRLEAKALSERFNDQLTKKDFVIKFGMNVNMVNQNLNCIKPISLRYAKAYAKFFDCKVIDISPRLHEEIKLEESSLEVNSDYSKIDMMDLKLSAGAGNIVISHDIKKQISFRSDFLKQAGCKPENALGFPVQGDSMIDVHIIDGSVVVLNTLKKEPIKNKYYAIWIDDKYYIKELVQKNGVWYAISHNAENKNKYPDIYIDHEFSGIIGQAFWCGFKL